MPREPFIDSESRPDLTIHLDEKVGELKVRDLETILGVSLPLSPEKPKDIKDAKDNKDRTKDPKDSQDLKTLKDRKDATKDNKDVKDAKDRIKDTKDRKDGKDLSDKSFVKDALDKFRLKEIRDMASLDVRTTPFALKTELGELIERVSALQQDVEELKKKKKRDGGST